MMAGTHYRYKFVITILIVTGVLISHPVFSQASQPDWKSFEDAMELAEIDQKPILIDVWAPWCGWCKKMQKEVYPQLSATLESDFILTRLNRDDNDSKVKFKGQSLTHLRLAQRLNVQSVPAIVFLSAEGSYIGHISGYIEAQDFRKILMRIE